MFHQTTDYCSPLNHHKSHKGRHFEFTAHQSISHLKREAEMKKTNAQST